MKGNKKGPFQESFYHQPTVINMPRRGSANKGGGRGRAGGANKGGKKAK